MPGPGAWIITMKRRKADGTEYEYTRAVYRRMSGGPNEHGMVGSRAECEEFCRRWKLQNDTKRRTVDEAIAAYREDMERRKLVAETVRQTEQRLRRIMSNVLSKPVSQLTATHCDHLYTALVDSGEFAASTHHRMLEAARTWGSWIAAAPKRRWVTENPWKGVERTGTRKKSNDECLRGDEANALRAKAYELAETDDEGALAVLIALMCSCRPHEIVQIRACDVDLGGALLWIDGERLKTENTRRRIRVKDARLAALLKKRAAVVQLATGESTARLFAHDRDFVADSTKRLCAAAGVRIVDARTLRRTFATLAAETGESLDDVAFTMGHGKGHKTLKKHYTTGEAAEAGDQGRLLEVLDGEQVRS